ncbi:MAG: PASTA domain-containing protein [Deltaproteobacteria bacterium]|nr:PASTA domain-containing protein [Deltaproteobacteria bacterium]
MFPNPIRNSLTLVEVKFYFLVSVLSFWLAWSPSYAQMREVGTIPKGMVSVPNIECKGKAEADRIFRAAGLRPVSIAIYGPVDPDTCDAYQAYRQDPRPGMIVPRGTKVTYRFWWEHG